MVYCCCTWKLLMSLKYTHYHANTPYIFFRWHQWLSVSIYSPGGICTALGLQTAFIGARTGLTVPVFMSVKMYGLLLKYGQFDEHTFTTNAIPLIRSGGLSFFLFRFFFLPPPHQFTGAAEDSCASQWCMGPAYSPKKHSSKHVCVYIW